MKDLFTTGEAAEISSSVNKQSSAVSTQAGWKDSEYPAQNSGESPARALSNL